MIICLTKVRDLAVMRDDGKADPTARLMCQNTDRPFQLEGGATFCVKDRFRASWSLLT